MIEIKIPKEVRSYKETIFFGLTLRQIICLGIALSINVPMYIFLKPYIGDEIASWIIMFTGVPLFLVGFFKFNGLPFEKFALIVLKFKLFIPQKRKYKVENIFTEIVADQDKINIENLKKSKERKKIK